MIYCVIGLVVVLFCEVGILDKKLKKIEEQTKDHRYLLYLGLQDKDTGVEKYSEDEAIKILNEICSKYLRGYNIRKSTGFWTDDNNQTVDEKSLVISFNFIEENKVHVLADEIVETFNQECVFIEDYHLTTEFYPSN